MYEVVATGGPGRAGTPLISVVVPTRNRRDLLAATIDGLFTQELSAGAYEIIVVDNASEDGTVQMLRDAAARSPVPFTAVRFYRDCGPAVTRNAGVLLSRGEIVAFTDSDCVPSIRWLSSCLAAFSTGVAVVQGRTAAHPDQRQPLFNHFIETSRLDGSFSTSNVAYKRRTLLDAGGFDPACGYWEDVDLGWRVFSQGAKAAFSERALVHHQVLSLSAFQWVMHARKFGNWPAKVARHPGFRRHLFLRIWAEPWHLVFQLFLLGAALSFRRRPFLLLTLPYIATFPLRRRLTGRWPAAKVIAYVARDFVSVCALVTGSIRHRRVVL